MKVIHWILYRPGVVSGMHSFSMSLYLRMLRLGCETYLCSSEHPNGSEIDVDGTKHRVVPWSTAMERDSVNILHTDIPPWFGRLPNRVFPTHGSPFYVFIEDYLKSDSSLAVSAYLADRCEMIICWNPRHETYWKELTDDPSKIVSIRGGVDLERYTPEGDKIEFKHHPSVGYCDAIRVGIKQPFTLLFAAKKVAREISETRLQLVGVPPEKQGFWHYLIGRLKLDVNVENIFVGMHPKIATIYRGLDMLVHPVSGGVVSSTGAEALACGCPVVILEGDDWFVASEKCRDDPDDMARAIFRLWDRIQQDRAKVREESRKLAEEHYNIENTVKRMMEAFERFFS